MTIDEKLEHFYKTSVEAAREKAVGDIEAHKASLAEMLAEHKKSQTESAECEIKAETENVRREINKALSAEMITLKRDWSQKQNQLADQLFAEVKEHLEAFTATPEYLDYLAEKIREARDFAGKDELHIYLSASDNDKLDTMTHKTGFPLEVSGESFIGGIKATIPGKNILIDNSFQENFNAVRGEFKFDGGLKA
ncbi:MAG: V-type ATP synthase subunit E [Blautia sp.]|nr:V-type ATP synthase subunit E [Blautia sp.]MDY3998531.1 V-type ATP synthase subunit E [Blautia sp.]